MQQFPVRLNFRRCSRNSATAQSVQPQCWVAVQQIGFTAAQLAGLHQQPHRYASAHNACFASTHVWRAIDAGKGIGQIARHRHICVG